MEVWSRDASCRSHFSKHLARFQVVSDLHVNFGKVRVESVNAETVIDDDGISGKEEFLCENHSSALSRVNKGSGQGGKIHPTVRRAGLAVQDAPFSEIAAGGHAIEWHTKLSGP
jgi:hypothetical protein